MIGTDSIPQMHLKSQKKVSMILVEEICICSGWDFRSVEVVINKYSDRLQKLEPFLKWDGKDFEKLPVLAKIEENVQLIRFPCWCMVMYRVHLDRISDNLVLGAVNAYRNGKVGNGMNVLNDNIESYPHIAREYKNGIWNGYSSR